MKSGFEPPRQSDGPGEAIRRLDEQPLSTSWRRRFDAKVPRQPLLLSSQNDTAFIPINDWKGMRPQVINAFLGLVVTVAGIFIGPYVGGSLAFTAIVVFAGGIAYIALRQRLLPLWLLRLGGSAEPIPFTTKRRNALLSRAQRLSYPYMVSVGWAYDKEGSGRLPTDAELIRINTCESALATAMSDDAAVLVGSLTSDGFHQFIFYGSDPARLQIRLFDSLPTAAEQCSAAEMWELWTTYDPSWSYAKLL